MGKEQFTGFHSVISVETTTSGKNYLAKSFGEKAGGYEVDDAVRVAGLMKRFHGIADTVGVPIVAPYGHYIVHNHFPGKVNFIEAQPHAGTNLQEVITQEPNPIPALEQYMAGFKKIWDNGSPLALDPVPANFCQDGNGIVRYVDLMPPRQKLPDGSVISEWPEPPMDTKSFMEARYFTPEGQIPVIYAQLLRTFASRKPEISYGKSTPDLVQTMMVNKFGPLSSDILRRGQQRLTYTQPLPTDSDFVRVEAAEAFFDGRIDNDQLKHTYHLTHIKNGGILPPQDQVSAAYMLLHKQ